MSVPAHRKKLAPCGDEKDQPPWLHERWPLLLPHHDRLLRLAQSRLGNLQDAEDCVQEAMLRAALFANLDVRRVGAFLTSTTLRLCVDIHRSTRRQQQLLRRIGREEWMPDPEETVCEASAGRWMMGLARQLRGRERQVMLAQAEGMSIAEAAHHLDISVKAVESALGRARARLRGAYDRAMRQSTRPSRSAPGPTRPDAVRPGPTRPPGPSATGRDSAGRLRRPRDLSTNRLEC